MTFTYWIEETSFHFIIQTSPSKNQVQMYQIWSPGF